MQQALDKRFKETGHVNAAFPLLIPKSFLEKEKEHVEGFAPELAIVTHGGGQELEEPLVIRPTSETVIGYMYAKWIKSYRDLPVLINQWANVVRWEMRTRLFLRTLEFYWQEGHTAHATQKEAEEETLRMLDVYADFAENEAAVPVIRGRKSASERFAGAKETYSIEAMMGDTKALQSGTSHFLGQNFAKAFEIQFLDESNQLKHVWTTSWGLSTRFVGAIIMAHGDDHGLVMPPRLAPYQIVLIPIYKNDVERSVVMPVVEKLKAELSAFRIKVDDRTEVTPGFKFNDWELRGVPLRIEVGPKDVEKGTFAMARRDIPGRDGKSFVPQSGAAKTVGDMLDQIQKGIFDKAVRFREDHIYDPKNYEELKEMITGGWCYSWWCGDPACEAKVKVDTKATTRNIPLDQDHGSGNCIVCGKTANEKVYFSRAY
jgi:prolyl-tRNA synthetase